MKKITGIGITALLCCVIGFGGAIFINFMAAVQHKLFIKGSLLYVVASFELIAVIGLVLLFVAIYRFLKKIDSL